MRCTASFTTLFVSLMAGRALAQSVSDTFSQIPSCALPCTEEGVLSAGCSLTNLTLLEDCLCTNDTLLSGMSTCVQTSCPFSEQVTTGSLLIATCAAFPIESRVSDVRLAAIVALALSVVVVSMRCVARLHRTGRLWGDDWMAVASAVLLVVGAGLELASAQLGFGLHYWDVQVANAAHLLQIFYAVEIIYTWVKLVAKASIILLYMRVFTARWFHLVCYGCLCYCGLSVISFTFVIAFQCRPVEAIWNHFIVGQCLDVNAIGYAGAVLSIVEDIVLVLLPIPELRKLQISARQRIGVGLMFGLASFATVTSMIRLKYLVQFSKTFDATYDNVNTVVWSLIEATCIIVCGSLPPLRPWFGKLVVSISTLKTRRPGDAGSAIPGKRNITNTEEFSELPEWAPSNHWSESQPSKSMTHSDVKDSQQGET